MDIIPSSKVFQRTIAGLIAMAVSTVAAGDPKAAGDVIGRDLDIAGFEKLGHLGVFGGRLIMECLNEEKPLQKNSVGSFKTKTRYWGARYIPERHDYRKVISAGWAQRNFDPSFTLSPVYTVGRHVNKRVWDATRKRWELRTVLVPARFRCDTFIYYSFKAGIGRKLAGETITPRIIFFNCGEAR